MSDKESINVEGIDEEVEVRQESDDEGADADADLSEDAQAPESEEATPSSSVNLPVWSTEQGSNLPAPPSSEVSEADAVWEEEDDEDEALSEGEVAEAILSDDALEAAEDDIEELAEARDEHEDGQAERFDSAQLIGVELAGRYDIQRRIGKGGMGIVYLANQSALDRYVVVKVLDSKLDEGADSEAVQRFEREALGLSQLQHPNVVTIYDFGRDRGLAYIVMEYVEGETLSRHIRRRGPLGFEAFAPLAAQILEALGDAHGRGVIHRDIKPSNIMLCERHGQKDFVKVLDFGLAKLVHDPEEVTKKQNLVGSVAFLAPEQILGLEFDQRVDVYALGVLFYYILSGQKPFRGEDDIAVLYQHIHKNAPLLHDVLPEGHNIPTGILDLVHLCLSKNPEERPKDAADLLMRMQEQASKQDFQIPWTASDSNTMLGVEPPSFTGSREIPYPPATPHSGQYGEISHTGNHQVSGVHQVPEQSISKRALALTTLAVLAIIASIAAIVFTTTNNPADRPSAAPEAQRERASMILGEVDELIDQQRWGQAEAMLANVREDSSNDPEMVRRIAEADDAIIIGRLLQRAMMAEEQGSIARAREHYSAILSRDPAHPEATERLAALPRAGGAAEGAGKEGTITIDAPVKARVTIDGEFVGYTPFQGSFAPTAHEVEVSADGYDAWTRSLELIAGESIVLDAELDRASRRTRRTREASDSRKTDKKSAAAKEKQPEEASPDEGVSEESSGLLNEDASNEKDDLLFPVDGEPARAKDKKPSNDLLPVGP